MLWKVSPTRWLMASYAWNETQTDAELAADGVRGAVEVAPGRRHSIPSRADCAACHGANGRPLGFAALQLSTDRDPNAIHGEPLAPGMITNATLAAEGRFSPARPELVASPPRIRTDNPRTRAVLGYFAANCGTCHNRSGEIAYSGPSLKHDDLGDGDGTTSALLAQLTAWQAPGRAEGTTRMLDDLVPDASAMLVRMRSRRPSSQMPPLGTVLRDEAAIDAVTKWIATDLVRR